MADIFTNCDCAKFSDGCWYKFTKKGVTKEKAIADSLEKCNNPLMTASVLVYDGGIQVIGGEPP